MTQTFSNGYALLVGVSENQAANLALPEVAKDVQAVQRVLSHPQRCAYIPENVRVLIGDQATRQSIFDGLAWLRNKLAADPNATAVVYYSGHGWRDTTVNPPAYYLIPYDLNAQQVRPTALRADDFSAEIRALQPRRLLVLLDCCHAAGMGVKELTGVMDLTPTISPGYTQSAIPVSLLIGDTATQGAVAQSPASGAKGLEQLAQGAGRAVLSSSQGTQVSYIRQDRAMSIFTYHLIEALTGHAQQPGATEVLISDVMSHVHRRVPESAKAQHNAIQQPDYQVSGNFPVALLLGGQGLSKGIAAPDPVQDLKCAPFPQAASAYTANLTGSGAISQGNNNTTVGAGGVIVKGDVQGDVVTGKKETINTAGGPYFGGQTEIGSFIQGDQTIHNEDRRTQVDGSGNIVISGDHNRVNYSFATGNAPTPQEFLDLLHALQNQLSQTPLPPEEHNEIVDDLAKVERQATTPHPNSQNLISRLDMVVNLLANSVTLITAGPQLLEMGHKLLEWAKILF